MFRKEPCNRSLHSFIECRQNLYIEISTFDLYALQQVLSSIGERCQEFLNDDYNDPQNLKSFKADIDWLMNQLIRGSQQKQDPFLRLVNKQDIEQDSSKSIIGELADRKPRIAIIDDQPAVGQYICQSLEDFVLNVDYYDSIDAFLIREKADPVDLIVLDVVMPDVTQEEVFEFATDMIKDGVKVISCSATFTFETRLLAVRANVSDYIVKPVNTYVLVEKIAKTLQLQRKKRYHVVIVDDQEVMGEFYKTILEETGCIVTFFSNAKDLFMVLDDIDPDMFLLDLIMPEVDGLEVARMIRQEHKFDFAPILFITGEDSIQGRLAAIDAGADDVILKSSSTQAITQQVSTRLDRASEVKAFVSRDPLTGVLNHGQIVEKANQTLRNSKKNKVQSAIAVIDADHFKQVNDKYGHLSGDKVLTSLGQLLSNSIKDTDFVGRYGGEEFVIVFHQCNLKEAAKRIQTIKNIFAKMRFQSSSGEFSVTFSGGVCNLSDYDNIQESLSMADKALYKAKENGRNKVIAYKA